MAKPTEIQPVSDERVSVSVSNENDELILTFKGNVDMEKPANLLDPLFNQTHEFVLEGKLDHVVIDFRELAFMNSSGIKAVAKWIMKQTGTPPAEQYRIIIKHDKKITWQMTSLPTLTFLLPGIVKVE